MSVFTHTTVTIRRQYLPAGHRLDHRRFGNFAAQAVPDRSEPCGAEPLRSLTERSRARATPVPPLMMATQWRHCCSANAGSRFSCVLAARIGCLAGCAAVLLLSDTMLTY